MIFDSDTIVDPRAVVIESFDALVADGAVLASGRANDFAIWTEVSGVDVA